MTALIRPIQPGDNAALAVIIRNSLAEFGADKPGTVFFDPTTDALFELFQTPGSFYFVAEEEGKLLGGGGIFPTEALPNGYCELVKMYLHKDARGKGLGKLLIEQCLQWAKEHNYTHCYLETMPELKQALKVYELFGFEYLNGPLGNSGHFGCDRWMLKEVR
ncbi:MAG TPA: GNAT family N-acetyltransferase [Lacibacter sp.]|nr:GNAT family N-acetyltransferase [Lacibacter sp.]